MGKKLKKKLRDIGALKADFPKHVKIKKNFPFFLFFFKSLKAKKENQVINHSEISCAGSFIFIFSGFW